MFCHIPRSAKIENLTQSSLLRSLVFTNPDWKDDTIVFDNAYIPGRLRDDFLDNKSDFISIPCCDSVLWCLLMASDLNSEAKEEISQTILFKNYIDPKVVPNDIPTIQFEQNIHSMDGFIQGPTFFLTNLLVNMVCYRDNSVRGPAIRHVELRARICERPKMLHDAKQSDVEKLGPHFYKLLKSVPKIVFEELEDLKVFGFDLLKLDQQYIRTPPFQLEDGSYLLRGEEYSLLMRYEEKVEPLDGEISKSLRLSLIDDVMIELIQGQITPVEKIDNRLFGHPVYFECLSLRTIDRLCSLYSFMHRNL